MFCSRCFIPQDGKMSIKKPRSNHALTLSLVLVKTEKIFLRTCFELSNDKPRRVELLRYGRLSATEMESSHSRMKQVTLP